MDIGQRRHHTSVVIKTWPLRIDQPGPVVRSSSPTTRGRSLSNTSCTECSIERPPRQQNAPDDEGRPTHLRRVESHPVEGIDNWPLTGIRCPARGGVSPPAGERRYPLTRGDDPRDDRPSRPQRADSSGEKSWAYPHGERRPENCCDSSHHTRARIIGTLLCLQICCRTGQ